VEYSDRKEVEVRKKEERGNKRKVLNETWSKRKSGKRKRYV
jgi:hypothetical protein